MKKEILKRHRNNPILTKDDIPYKVETVHNAAVAKFNGEYVMLFRSHLDNGRSIIGKATSSDGVNFTASDKPFMVPSDDPLFYEYEAFGLEDPRITYLQGSYYITYSAYSQYGVRIGLACTEDFKTVDRIAFITQADYRNTVIFPEKINNQYVKLDRPHCVIFNIRHFNHGDFSEDSFQRIL